MCHNSFLFSPVHTFPGHFVLFTSLIWPGVPWSWCLHVWWRHTQRWSSTLAEIMLLVWIKCHPLERLQQKPASRETQQNIDGQGFFMIFVVSAQSLVGGILSKVSPWVGSPEVMFSWPILTCFTSPSWPPTLVGGTCGETQWRCQWHCIRQWWWKWCDLLEDLWTSGSVILFHECWICQAWTSSVYGSGWGWCPHQTLNGKLRHVVVSLSVATDHFAELAVHGYLNVMATTGTYQAVNESKKGTCLSRKLWRPYGASIATFSKSVRT